MSLAALVPGTWPVLVAAICVGGTFMVITLAGMEAARCFGQGRAARLTAAMTAGFAAGQLLGPVAMFASGARSFEPLCLLAALGLACSVLLLRDPDAAVRSTQGR
jgi:hypothetical protein